MTTNYEWLLNMDGEERQAWFDAEHVEFECPNDAGEASMMSVEAFIAEHKDTLAPENVVTSDDVDANDGNDTREKLEADVREFSNVYYVNNFNVYDKVIELLDRQAAMTEREMVDRYTNELRKFKDMNNDAGEEIAELQSQLDEIAELVGWHGEVDGNSGESLLVPMVGAMCDGSEVAAKLKDENAKLKEKVENQRKELGMFNEAFSRNVIFSADGERQFGSISQYYQAAKSANKREEAMREALGRVREERDELREKLGIALDHAHDLLSLVNLDGEVIS